LPLNTVQLKSGDSVLFATGQHYVGMLSLINIKGSLKNPIVISSFKCNNDSTKPVLDAGSDLNSILIQNASFVVVKGIEITATQPYQNINTKNKSLMRCGILVEAIDDNVYETIVLKDLLIHDVYYNAAGFKRTAEETKSANGTQSYGWGIRFINNTKDGYLKNVEVSNTEIYNVSHTGLKYTAKTNGIQNIVVANNFIHHTGGPGIQMSGVKDGHVHHNSVDHSGSTNDSRNWGRGSGMWTWGCSNILIEYNKFQNANGPGDSAGIHIDFNCNDVVVQYCFSANNAGGFCEILGNNFNCAYRYNISYNDGYRNKGVNGAFQDGKTFWLSGYIGNQKPSTGPFNSYFYNNTIYVAPSIIPKIAISATTDGILIANNIFYFERKATMVAGDQKQFEQEKGGVSNVFFNNNLFLQAGIWPKNCPLQDEAPFFGDPMFENIGGNNFADYTPKNNALIQDQGIEIMPLPKDKIGLKIGLKVTHDILGNPIKGLPDMGAIEIKEQ
jgi:hypothetical protein